MAGATETTLTAVERAAAAAPSGTPEYPSSEKISTIVVENFPALGKLAALRFIEWVQHHPGGVISLPTGKTPEYFIHWVARLLNNWGTPEVDAELERNGIDPVVKPDMQSLYFVQIDEFYPMDSAQQNSFFYYVNHFYIKGFGLDPAKALLIDNKEIGLRRGQTLHSVWPHEQVDLGLRYRAPATLLEQTQKEMLADIDQWCQERETQIRQLGGIGFFLGGIGPDGHIGFNVRGSDHHSTTRLSEVNYETQAAAATDLGGIEVARKHLVITIGLGTITYNPACCAIVIAAGEAKAGIVGAALQEAVHVNFPATALQALPNARFYITAGAATLLQSRRLVALTGADAISAEEAERIVVDLAVERGKRLVDLERSDFAADPRAAALLQKHSADYRELRTRVRQSLVQKIERGAQVKSNTRFLHTEPHHDDLMLGCLPFIVRHVRDPGNTHYFACLTSGFTSVTNRFMRQNLERLRRFIDAPDCREMMAQGYFEPEDENGRNRDVWQYLDGVAANDASMRDEGAARRFLRNLIAAYGEREPEPVKRRIEALAAYFRDRYPGQKDSADIQQLKGMCREWEAECLWGYFGWDCSRVLHLRLGFYTGDIFTQEPTEERDVAPVLKMLQEVKPDVLSVAIDPEASGPDTHYKVLQTIAAALQRYQRQSGRTDIKVWGYRNVWYRFHPGEANVYVPVSLNMFSTMHSAFLNTFISQKDASFPSYEHDGPFSELAQRIQVEQYQKIKTCLGREWFQEHPSPLIRATRGLVFLHEHSLDEFYARSRALRSLAENK